MLLAVIIYTATTIQSITDKGDSLELTATNGTLYQAAGIILAIPPQLAAQTMVFEPQLPAGLLQVIHHTQTWMGGSIKLAVEYEQPFWKQNKPVSTLFSDKGTATEIYDHTDATQQLFALKGFLLPILRSQSFETGKAMATRQLVQYFGEQAAHYLQYWDAVWLNETIGMDEKQLTLSPH